LINNLHAELIQLGTGFPASRDKTVFLLALPQFATKVYNFYLQILFIQFIRWVEAIRV